MSLVHEALQKAEREKQRKAGVWQPPGGKPAPKPAHQLGPTESVTGTTTRSIPVTRAAESGGTLSVAASFVAGQSASPAVVADSQKKSSGLLPALIVCVSLVAIVAIVFLVGLAASTIRDTRQTERGTAPAPSGAGDVQPTRLTVAPEPRPSEAAPSPVVSDPVEAAAPQPPAPPPGSVESGFRLTGIMILPDGKYAAVLNGRVVYEASDAGGGATVKSILRDRLTLTDAQGKEIVLRLN